MRKYPHADYVPGKGCGCRRCNQPLPYVPVMTPEEARERQRNYLRKLGRRIDTTQ